MRCGRILVEGEAEDITHVSPKPAKPRQRRTHRGKKNPYSSVGLDKFARLNAELSARREYVARKTGTPEAMVRFIHTPRGWVSVVVKGGKDNGISILPPSKLQSQNRDNYESIRKEEDGIQGVKADEGYENGDNGSASMQETVPVIMPWWSGYLKTTAFGALTLSAIMVRKSAVPAAAMAVVMVVGFMQKRWLGGVMCMKRFIGSGISYFSELFLYWKKRSLEIQSSPSPSPPRGSLQVVPVQQPVASPPPKPNIVTNKRAPLRCLSAPCSPDVRGQASAFSAPKNSTKSQELNTQLQGKKIDNKQHKFRRIVSMDGQATKPIRLQKAETFVRKRKAGGGAIDATVGITVMIILLFFLVFYGRLSAIFFTSAWWYVLPHFRTSGANNNKKSG